MADSPLCTHCDAEHGADGLVYHASTCPTLTAPYDIVRELAERGPFTYMGGCDTCEIGNGPASHVNDPANHEPSCLWRRAKALYPGESDA